MNDSITARLRELQDEMLACSSLLKERGSEEHGEEMFGAARILSTWIEGIANDQKGKDGA